MPLDGLPKTTPAIDNSQSVAAAQRLKQLRQTAAPAAVPPETLTSTVCHKVKAGETIGGIAERYRQYKPEDMDLAVWSKTIQLLNGLSDGSTLKVGQVLRIPQLAQPPSEQNLVAPRSEGDFDPAITLILDPATRQRPAASAPVTPLPTKLGSVIPPTIEVVIPGPTRVAPVGTATAGPQGAPTATNATTETPETPPAKPPVSLMPKDRPVVATARDSLGVRYVWGGESLTKGTDCSGLTKTVFQKVEGVALPRTSQAQFASKEGQPVSRPDLQSGDLVFFKNSKGKIVHVGIYAGLGEDGKQKYISATTTKGVAEYGIDAWTRSTGQRYAGARRFAAQ